VLRALPAAARRERAALLLRCSRACASSDRIGEATAEAEAALQLWRAEGDRLREADTLSRLAMLAWTSDRIGAAVDLGRAAADLLARLPPSIELARALAIVARLLANHYAHPDATSWARRALALADELGEHRIAAHAAVDLGMVLAAQGFTSGRGLVEQAVIRARALGSDDEAAYGMFTLARLASAASDHDGLQAAVAEARSFCYERGIEIWADYIQMIEAQDLLHRGEWAEADTLARELWRRTTPTSPASRVAVACTTLGLVRLRRGEPDPDTLLEVAAGRLADAPVTNPVLELASARAEAAWYAGGPRTVEAEVRALWDVARQREGWWVDELRWWLTVADGPAATAREWRAAAQRWTERGHPYHRALALSASAEEAALREALSIAHDLGARPLAARVAHSLRALGVRRVPRVPAAAATLSGPLSAREHEVLALLAEGLRDAEIAARLHLSPRTVNHHVSAVLQKLAAPSRTAAVRRALREGLLTSE
jgi:DNA-binding CsgD family transcriptional regulator